MIRWEIITGGSLPSDLPMKSNPHMRFKFLTNNFYEGPWNNNIMSMEGFGKYQYEDGTLYRGNFKNGKFDGYGLLKLGHPYKLTFEGIFIDGKLEKVFKMHFHDKVPVHLSVEDDLINIDMREFCTKEDRRYARELWNGLQPVNETVNTTAHLPPRHLLPGDYDIEEGVYKPYTSFVTERTKPLQFMRFLGCKQRKKWILDNARKRPSHGETIEPNGPLSRDIIRNNIKSEMYLQNDSSDKEHLFINKILWIDHLHE